MTNSRNILGPDSAVQKNANLSRWFIGLLFLIPVIIYLPGIMGKIPYPSESAQYTDLILSHYPNALYLKKSILEFQQIPLWSTFIHSGAPFAANPLAGLFYLPGWLALVFPLPEGISVLLAAHAVFASWGMFLFLKSENIGELGAIAGGLIFGLAPKFAAHYGAGHVTLLYAISWTPWLFWISKKDQCGWKTGIVAALLFLADPRWSVYAGIFWFSFDIAHRHSSQPAKLFLYYLKAGITAALIASPLIIPMYEFIGLSTRLKMESGDVLAYSMSPEKILGFLIPSNWGNPEWYIYSGGMVFGLFLIQFFLKEERNRNRFWIFWIIASSLAAFGSWFVNPEWITLIPLISLLRVPSRALFLVVFSFSVIAARTMGGLLNHKIDPQIINRIAFGLGLGAIGLALTVSYLLGMFSVLLIWGFVFLLILSLMLPFMNQDAGRINLYWVILCFIILDLLGAGLQSFSVKDFELGGQSEILDLIREDKEIFRLYSPSYSVPQRIAVEQGLELADGVDPMQIAVYSGYMEKATGIPNSGYSVTIPPFETGNPAFDNAGSTPDAFLLSLLNVKYVISDFKIENQDLLMVKTEGSKYLYENRILSARAWIEAEPKNRQNPAVIKSGTIHEIDVTPNHISINASGPGKLVLSEVMYPGWFVSVDGEKKQIDPAYGVLRSVAISEGNHQIEFTFWPIRMYLGIAISLFGWVVSIWQINQNENDGLHK